MKKKKIDKNQLLYWAVLILFAVLVIVFTQIWTEKQLATILNFSRSDLVLRFSPQDKSNTPTKDWQNYTDENYRFKFSFPPSWILDSKNPDDLIMSDPSGKITIEYFATAEKISTASFNYQNSKDTTVGMNKSKAIVSTFESADKKSGDLLKIVYLPETSQPQAITLTYNNDNLAETEAIFNSFLNEIQFFN